MRRSIVILLAAALPTLASPARAQVVGPEALLAQAVEQYGLAEFGRALDLLHAAEKRAGDPKVLAAIYRQRGVVQEVLRKADEAIVSFARALRCDPAIELVEGEHKRSAVRLFELSRAALTSGADAIALQRSLGIPLGPDGDACERAPEPAPAVAPAAPAAPAVPRAATPPAPRTRWPIWASGGAAVVAAAAGGTLGVLALGRDRACSRAETPDAFADCDRSATALETGVNVSFAAAGTFAVLALVLWIAGDAADPAVDATIAPGAAGVRF